MTKDHVAQYDSQLELAIALARQALVVCDDEGFMFAAIHLCVAIEALQALQKTSAKA